MPVKDPGLRRSTALAVAIVFVLSGAGVAVAWAASAPAQARDASPQVAAASPSQSQSQSETRKPDKAQDKGKARELHSEGVVKKPDGSLEKRVTQIGTVESVSDTSITVKSEDGFSQEYVINTETRIRKVPKPGADGTAPKDDAGKRLKPSAATAADLKQGDTVRIAGVRDGSAVTATVIVEGAAANGKGLGKGFGKGLGQGQGLGKGLGRGKGLGQGQGQG